MKDKKIDWNVVWKVLVSATSFLGALFSFLSFGMTCGFLF